MECLNSEQRLGRLTPPFIFGEGIRGNNRNNATCMDYKARYCCKSTAMFRPTPVSYLENKVPLVLPVGAISGICSLDGDGSPRELWMTISPAHGIAKPTVIKMKADNGSLTGSLRGIQTFSVTGKIKTKELQDQTLLVAVNLFRDSKKEFAAIKMTLDKGSI